MPNTARPSAVSCESACPSATFGIARSVWVFDPDLRVQEAVRVIFARFRQHGSARQVLLSLAAEQM